ncbi:SGNH/GDSL hydrolase family protein [Bradyrhizobium guangzhouense]|uniref:SGNH/GDSL hydrolase family protein n=1 Tax=Bradyrhizobium guangzhouense TaxID=1325095 RepID=A0AAE5WWV4_9BRAD|nr:SGNH/GDSL hydrolase family protein [Bradyrhizobium guangzhouense]QAU44526.1 hypothetical protein XH91_03595 [Bradyrhizobium guangzhouense]RXH12676.1 SGNH/GDSL hydrolase family protein [Bradyrhizobium guangzhouense]
MDRDDEAVRGGPKLRRALHSLVVFLIVTAATLAVLETVLRIADFRELRDGVSERSLSYAYDAELGWAPVPGSTSVVTNARTIHASHNSLGLRDEEFIPDARPTIMFLGDSFVWGLDVEAGERFSELLKPRMTDYKILAAGVSGYGTDQEFLLLQRLWPKVKPAIVVLIFCTNNDREDNSTNIRYEGYHKPYFTTAADGVLVLQGQPVPTSRLQTIRENWWVNHVWLLRLANAVYLKLMYPKVQVPDPTERLIDKIKEFVETNGARFLVGLQATDESLVRHLQATHVPFVTFDGADAYPGAASGAHWTPEGHKFVAEKLYGLLSANGVVGSASPTPDAQRK